LQRASSREQQMRSLETQETEPRLTVGSHHSHLCGLGLPSRTERWAGEKPAIPPPRSLVPERSGSPGPVRSPIGLARFRERGIIRKTQAANVPPITTSADGEKPCTMS
jgi:hypothetical protein